MRIPARSFADVVSDLSYEIRKQIEAVDENDPEINEKGGFDAFAEIKMKDGLFLNLQLTCTVNRREEEIPN